MDYCPHCANRIEIPLPVEPVYSLETTAQLAPMTLSALKSWINKHKDVLSVPRYSRHGYGNRVSLVRLLTASDVRIIHAAQVKTLAEWRPPRGVGV